MSAMLVIPALAILLAPAIWLVLGRPRFLPPGDKELTTSSISVVIPARNEESNIATLLESLRKQSLHPLEIIVVDDGSSDNTASIATDLGARVIKAKPLPDDWMGKPWACQQGAEAATGDWLLFLDADLDLNKDAMRSLQHLTNEPGRVYSVCPYHTVKKPYEELSAFFNVLMLAGVNAFGPGRFSHGEEALFGQCMLISQEHYRQAGGHKTVRDKTLENFHLARRLGELGIGRSCYLGRGAIGMRMFPGGIKELWQSWKKGFSGGAAHTAPRALLLASLWISSMMLTIVCLALLATPFSSDLFNLCTGIAYGLNACQCLVLFRLAGSFTIWNALLFPLALIFYQTLFFCSMIDNKRGKRSEWKGRTVH